MAIAKSLEVSLTTIMTDRDTFQGFTRILERSSGLRSNHFSTAVARWYADASVIAVRRLADDDPRAMSLLKLLRKMISTPSDFSADYFEELGRQKHAHRYPAEMLGFLLDSTYEPFADASGRNLNIAKIEADCDRLRDAVSQVKEYADRVVAHLDRRGYETPVTWDMLWLAMDTAEDIVKRYVGLFTGAGYSSFAATPQYDWLAVFQPLLDG